MGSRVQLLAARAAMSYDDFIGEMRKRGCSEPTAMKIWNGVYENYEKFSDNDIYLSKLLVFNRRHNSDSMFFRALGACARAEPRTEHTLSG